MAVRHGYGKVAGADALVFAYDTGDTENSFKGEPTENLFGTTAMEFKSDNPTYTTAITNGSDDIGTYIIKDTASAPWWSGLRVYNNGVRPLYAGVSYVVSFECRSSQYDWSWGLDANASGGGWSGNDLGRASYTNLTFDKTGGTVYTSDMVNTWQRVTYRVTMKDATTFTGADAYPHDSFFPNQNNIKVYYRNPQIEVGRTTATRYTPGERSATQGLLDLTGNRSINLTNTTFDSNAQVTFDGTDDGINLGTNMLSLQNASFSLEAVIKWDGGSTDTFFGYTYANAQRQNIHWRIYDTGQLRFDFYSDSINSGTGQIVANTWTHLLVTYNYGTDTCICYKNGSVLMQGASGPFTGVDASSTAYLGYWGGSGQYFGGDIPIFKAYSRALTAAEVKNNYNNYKGRFNI